MTRRMRMLAVVCLVASALRVPAQTDAPLDPAAEFLAAVERAEQLRKAGAIVGAREASQAAWALCERLDAAARATASVQSGLWRLGHVAYGVGELRIAHDAWNAALEHRSRTLPDDHMELQRARGNVAATKKALGDLRGALELEEKVFAVRSAILPDDHPHLQVARGNLGMTRKALGDLRGALVLFEKVFAVRSATLPDDHPDLQDARQNLALTKKALGDLRGALALEEKVLAVRSATLPDDDPALQAARLNLAGTKYPLGDRPGALALFEKVFAVRSATLADDHPDLQRARQGLAGAKYGLGDLQGAMVLFEKVFAVFSETLPGDHPDLQAARLNLALARKALGDLRAALPLEEKAFAVCSETLPDDHPDLQRARQGLAGTKLALGDLRGALVLFEKVFAVCSETLPDDHPDLQTARGSLAAAKLTLGDLRGALALFEKVCAVSSATLPDDHPDLQAARQNLAATKAALGDLRGALELFEKVFAVCAETLSDDHPDLQAARGNLALVRRDLGDPQSALGLFEKVLAVRAATLPDDHPDLQAARLNLALTKSDLGDLAGALALEEKVFAVRAATLPDDHPDLQSARGNLARTKRALGDLSGALTLTLQRASASQHRVRSWALAPRQVGALARNEIETIWHLASLRPLCDQSQRQDLAASALLTDAQLRGAELRAARLRRVARLRDSVRVGTLEADLRGAVDEVDRIANARLDGEGAERDASRRARDERLGRAVQRKEDLEREIAKLAFGDAAERPMLPRIGDLAASLPEHAVGVAYLEYTLWTNDPDEPWITHSERRVAALVLDREGAVTWCELGSSDTVTDLVARVRMLTTGDRGRPLDGESGPATTLRQLGRMLLDPVLAALPEDTTTCLVSLADALQLVPLDALPLPSGEPCGDRYRLWQVASLIDVLEAAPGASSDPPTLVALGGIDYDELAGEREGVLGDAAAPVDLPGDRSGAPDRFRKLLDTKTEVRTIASAFSTTHEGVDAELRLGKDASKHALVTLAPRATYLHIASHGYFAPESVRSIADVDDSPLSRFDFDRDDTVSGLSPLVLTGLALAGANLPPDDLGRREGIITAEELAQLDLTRCHLATLSACDTSLGVRRAGQGFASLRAALQSAGARYVLTSLWKVNDEAAMELMTDFYGRLWREQQDPYEALWAAKRSARKRGAAFRDWAGWVLSGR